MIRGLTKSLNLLSAGYSYVKSSVTGHAAVYGMPPALGVELTNHCNLNCPECLSGSGRMSRVRGFMEPGLFSRVISELEPYLININLYFQGEPLLHPGFSSFIMKCRDIRTVISTNGHYLTEENSIKIAGSGLSKLIISLDGADQAAYSAYRLNGSLKTVLEGIANITDAVRKCRSSLKIEVQFLVNKYNEIQIPQIRRMAAGFGCSLKLKSMQVISSSDIEKWMPLNDRFRRYRKSPGEYLVKSTLPARCARLWFSPVITWDGKVLPCCFDKNADHIMGDLNHESFTDIWNGAKYRLFRRMLLSDRRSIEICRNCTSGLKGVKY